MPLLEGDLQRWHVRGFASIEDSSPTDEPALGSAPLLVTAQVEWYHPLPQLAEFLVTGGHCKTSVNKCAAPLGRKIL